MLMYAKDAYWKTGDMTLVDKFLQVGIKPEYKDYDGNDLFYYINENEATPDRKSALLEHLKTAVGGLRQS